MDNWRLGVKIFSTVEQSRNEINSHFTAKKRFQNPNMAQKYRIVIINENQTNKKDKKTKTTLLSIILTLTM